LADEQTPAFREAKEEGKKLVEENFLVRKKELFGGQRRADSLRKKSKISR